MLYSNNPWTTQGGRLQSIQAGPIATPASLLDLDYSYDLVGNVLSIQDSIMGSPQTQSFVYDTLNRLTNAQAAGGSQGNYGPEAFAYNPTTGNLASKAGANYTYGDTNHKHAVTALSNGNTYSYDSNGNMTQRIVGGQTYNLAYDAENRLTQVSGAVSASFVYNGDGQRVKATIGGATTVFIGNYYEWKVQSGESTQYYYAETSRIAVRRPDGSLRYLLGDHLGSTSVSVNADGTGAQVQGYLPWGETRFGSVGTEYRYTGQREEASLGLYDFGARWYDPDITRFLSPDTVIPGEQVIYSPLTVDYHETQFLEQLNEENRTRYDSPSTKPLPVPTNSQSFDRYSYAANNPIKYVDPSGHCFGFAGGADTVACTFFAAAGPPGWIVDAAIVVIGLAIVGTLAVIATDVYSGQQDDTINNFDSTANISQKDSLPTAGDFPYVSPKQKGKSVPIPVPGGGFRDANGNIWKRDHSGHYGGPHWDVQHPDGSHTNVDDKGNIIKSEILPLREYWGPR